MSRRHWTKLKLRYALVLAFIAGMLGLPMAAVTATSAPALADATHQAVIGMPFTGKWAYNVNVNPPYTDQNSSYPAVHAKYYGDWATDVYASAGTAVHFEVPYATGKLSYSWVSFANGSCGQRTVIDVKVDGVDVGSVYYEHMANAVKSGPITNGMVVGYVHDWGGCNPGPHVHIELKNATNYSCWVDHGHPGVTLTQGTNFGVLGSTNTGAQQKCASVPGGTAPTPTPSPPNLVGDIAATNQANGLEEVFYVGGDNAIWYRWQNADGSWSAEHTLSAGAHAITATDTSSGRIQLFYVGGDNSVWTRSQTAPNTDSWSAESRLGGGVG